MQASLAKSALIAFVGLATVGCQYISPPGLYERRVAAISLPQQPASTDVGFTVLTYNVEGLAWPARAGRGSRLRIIEERLSALHAQGVAPDIVLLQEAFSREAIAIARNSGYANVIPGPARGDRRQLDRAEIDRDHARERNFFRGERLLGRRTHSGLYILTDLPVHVVAREPFSGRACAGFDCLSNKGVMMVRVGLPNGQTLDVFNTHFNSRRAARVDLERADAAHRFQLEESSIFLDRHRTIGTSAIYGGDFNMRGAPERFDPFDEAKTEFEIAHRFCARNRDICDVALSWDGDEPWMDTQDLQIFQSSESSLLEPVRIEAMFDEPVDGRPLSDHDGLLVTYRVRAVHPSRQGFAR